MRYALTASYLNYRRSAEKQTIRDVTYKKEHSVSFLKNFQKWILKKGRNF
jgi:hypothetical protein